MRPACLDHSYFGISEVMDNPDQPIFGRYEVGVEDGNELALRRLHSFLQGASLESITVGAVVIADRMSQGCIALYDGIGDLDGLVSRIVQHLNIKLLPRVFHLAHRIHQPIDYELFIKDRKLHRNSGQIGETRRRFLYLVLAMLVIKINKHISVDAIGSKN